MGSSEITVRIITMALSCWPRRRVSFAPPARGEDGSGASVEDSSGGPKRDVSPAPSGESGWSQAPGDSVASASMPEEEEDPADFNSAPPAVAERRKPRDTAPPAVAEGKGTRLRSSVLNDRADVGNIGFFFGNWGQRTKQKDGRVQDNIDAQIKKNPAQIIGLTECEKETQAVLESPAVAGDSNHEGGSCFEARRSHEYITLRGKEEVSVLVGVRSAVAEKMELLLWDRKYEGDYKCRGGKKMKAYTRTLITKITLKHNVGWLGNELRVAVCHLHFAVANKNKGFRKNNDSFWPWLAKELRKHAVHVLMGDFNMSLFKVVPELRSRGVHANLCSWFPWLSAEEHVLMSDSCGIFFVMPCAVKRIMTLDMVAHEPHKLMRLPTNGGPGQTLETYLPKTGGNVRKIKDSMVPAPVLEEGYSEPGEYADAVAMLRAAQSAVAGKHWFKVREKSLDPDIWMYHGANHKGSHFPLCAFTNSTGRRSEESYVKRLEKQRAIQRAKRSR